MPVTKNEKKKEQALKRKLEKPLLPKKKSARDEEEPPAADAGASATDWPTCMTDQPHIENIGRYFDGDLTAEEKASAITNLIDAAKKFAVAKENTFNPAKKTSSKQTGQK